MHTGQHHDDELSRVFFDELGVPAPDHQLHAVSGTNTAQTARILAELEPILAERGARARARLRRHQLDARRSARRGPGAPAVAHVEAGMRSFDRSMPEELNRVLVDHASDLLLCSTATAVENLERESRARASAPGRRRDGGRVAGLPATRRASARPRWPSAASSRARYLLVTAHRAGNVDPPERLRRSWSCSRRCPRPVVFPRPPAHAPAPGGGGPLERLAAAAGLELAPPLGYLDFLELARNARAVLTDSGGVQKEAYLLGVPCVTLRDTTEWVETVDAGWNVLVDLDRDAALAALDRGRPRSDPSCTAAGTPRSGFATWSRPTLSGYENRDRGARLRRPAAWPWRSARPVTR